MLESVFGEFDLMNPLLDGGFVIGGLADEIVDENGILLALW